MSSRFRENSNHQTRFTVKVDASAAPTAKAAQTAADYTRNRYSRYCLCSDSSLSMQKLSLSLLRISIVVVAVTVVIGSLGAIMSPSTAHAARIGNFSAFVWHRNLLPDFDQGACVCVCVCALALGVKVVDLFSYITRTWRTRRLFVCALNPNDSCWNFTDPPSRGSSRERGASPLSLSCAKLTF